ncbi:hypothetical protein [Streptomyces sp. NPDC007929]|uniref:hypothetical protein n=1 Tax=unclassified Streptomyces TaxID=2593676 RepID=UPI0036E693B1
MRPGVGEEQSVRFDRRLSTVAGVLLALAVALTGCGAVAEPAAGTRPAAPGGAPLTEAQLAVIDRAELVLTKKCMARHGHPFWVAASMRADELRAPGYVLDDVGWAHRHGYGGRIQRKALATKRHDRNIAYRAGLSEAEARAYVRALSGGPGSELLTTSLPGGGKVRVGNGGCEAEARKRLYGDPSVWFRVDKVATNLTPLYVPRLLRDEHFTKAQRRWAACMRRAGHSYPDPTAIRAALPRLTQDLDAGRAHATEVRLAVAEATCARETGFAETARRLEREHSAPVRARYARDIATRDRLQRAALARAERLLGE